MFATEGQQRRILEKGLEGCGSESTACAPDGL